MVARVQYKDFPAFRRPSLSRGPNPRVRCCCGPLRSHQPVV